MSVTALCIGFAAITATIGASAAAKGGVNQHNAKKIAKDADERLLEGAERLNMLRKECNASLENLGKEKIYVLDNNMRRFLDAFTKLKNVDFTTSEGLNELSKLNIQQKDFDEIAHLTNIATSLVAGTASGAVGGALTAFGAYGAAMTFATASTGTAISTLSGVAATNATLAFFGGGSLAAGGLGVAGGSAVLGGVVAGPAIMIMGIIVNAQTGKNLENAKAYAAQADEVIAEYEAGGDECIGIRRRSYMFYNLLARLDAYFLPLIFKMEDIIHEEGIDYSLYSLDSKKTIASAAAVAVTIKSVLDTPILSESGALTEESGLIAGQVEEKVENLK